MLASAEFAGLRALVGTDRVWALATLVCTRCVPAKIDIMPFRRSTMGLRLLRAVLLRTADGTFVREAGIMGIVAEVEPVSQGDPVVVHLPEGPHYPLDRV